MLHRQIVVFELGSYPIGCIEDLGEFPARHRVGPSIGTGQFFQKFLGLRSQHGRLGPDRIKQGQHETLRLTQQRGQEVGRSDLGMPHTGSDTLGIDDRLAALGGETFKHLRHVNVVPFHIRKS